MRGNYTGDGDPCLPENAGEAGALIYGVSAVRF